MKNLIVVLIVTVSVNAFSICIAPTNLSNEGFAEAANCIETQERLDDIQFQLDTRYPEMLTPQMPQRRFQEKKSTFFHLKCEKSLSEKICECIYNGFNSEVKALPIENLDNIMHTILYEKEGIAIVKKCKKKVGE